MNKLLNIPVLIFSTTIIIWGCGPQQSQEASSEDSIVVTLDESQEITSLADTEDLLLGTMMNSMMYTSLGQIASEKASSEEVKNFANNLAQSNEEIALKIEELFGAAGGDAPEVLGVEQQAKVDSLRELPTGEFDQAFVNMVATTYEDDIESIQTLETEADNAIVRGLAAEAENMMQAQLEKARVVKEEMM